MKYLFLTCLLFTTTALANIKLYTIDCGEVQISNFGMFSDTGDFDNKAVNAPSPCFLITHPKGNFLWDMGIRSDETVGPFKMVTGVPLSESLKKIGLTLKDINLIGFSHLHFDHIGQSYLFPHATWIMNETEYKNLGNQFGEQKLLSAYKKAKKTLINSDHDVFGDGSVRIFQGKGHTHGHQFLQVKLVKSGSILLSGDLYHQRESREKRLVPIFNPSRADTLASMDRLEGILRVQKARLIIQHDQTDVKSLPVVPQFLD